MFVYIDTYISLYINAIYMYFFCLIAFGCLCPGDAVLDGVDSNNPTASTTGAGQSSVPFEEQCL